MSKFKCPECNYETDVLSNLRRHLRKTEGWKEAKIQKEFPDKRFSKRTKPRQETPAIPFEDFSAIADRILAGMPMRRRLEVKPPKKGDLKPESWLLQFSDLHFGLRVKTVEVGGLSEYNTEIAAARLEYLAETLGRLLEYYPLDPKELVIAFQGDMVEGSIMRGNQQASIEEGIVQQTILVSELLTDFIISLTPYFPRIRCYGVSGNHGRLTKSPTDSHPAENFDKMVYYIIKERIKNLQGVSLEYTDAQHMIVQIGEKKFWLEHGDTIRSWTGIPFYGGKREKANINDILSNFREYTDYVLVGHHHTRAIFEDIFFNGSFVGGDLFSIGRLRRMNLPSQNLFGVDSKRGVVWERPLFLVEHCSEQPITIYGKED